MNKNNKQNKYLKGILLFVLIDLITKLWANFTLEFQETTPFIKEHLGFYLTYNKSYGSMVYSESEQLEVSIHYFSIKAGITALILGIYILLSNRLSVRGLYKVLLGFLLYFVLDGVIIPLFKSLILSVNLHDKVFLIFPMLSVLFLLIVLFNKLNHNLYKWAFVLFISGGIGNILSYTYSPYYVIDFIDDKYLSRYLEMGIYNIADVWVIMGYILLILVLLVQGVNWVKKLCIKGWENIN